MKQVWIDKYVFSEMIKMINVKETAVEDINNIQMLCAEGDVMKFVGFPEGLHYSEEEMIDWYRRIESNRPALNHFSIFDDGKYCGESFYNIDAERKTAALDIKLFGFARGRGIAASGLSHAIKEAFQNGAETVWVNPNSDNMKAITLYKRLGFQNKDFPEHLIPEEEEPSSIYMELRKE